MGLFDSLPVLGFALMPLLIAALAAVVVALLGIITAIARLVLSPITRLLARVRPQPAAISSETALAAVADDISEPVAESGPITVPPLADETPPSEDRRKFLTKVSLALGGLGGAIVGVPVLGVLFAPVRRDATERWRPVGAADEFAVGSTTQVEIVDPDPLPWAGPAALQAAWLRRDSEDQFTAFSAYCTHVGCPVRWEQGAGMFMCPCHGGAFHRDGSVAAGPPPQPLARYPVRVGPDGTVEVRTSPVPLPGEEDAAGRAS
jgi:menaquinol-cytochrome c reductase iron-sulfur subunit